MMASTTTIPEIHSFVGTGMLPWMFGFIHLHAELFCFLRVSQLVTGIT